MADKQKFLDYDGVKLLKKNLDGEKFDRKILETNVFNDITGYSLLTVADATNFDFEDTTNYNLVTITFPSDTIVLDENLKYFIVFEFYDYNGDTYYCRKIVSLSDLTQENNEIKCVITTTIGDYISNNLSTLDSIKEEMYSYLCAIEITEESDNVKEIIINGYDNYLEDGCFNIVNGEYNEVYSSYFSYTEGYNNVIDSNNYSIVTGSNNNVTGGGHNFVKGYNNKANYAYYATMNGYNNYINYSYFNTIFGRRNRLPYGTYIPKSAWSSYNANTSVTPVEITLSFSINSDYTWLQGNLPQAGDTIDFHSYYGIRPCLITEITCDDTNLVTIKFNYQDYSQIEIGATDTEWEYCSTGVHGLLLNNYGYNKSCEYIFGEYNSSYGSYSGIFGLGNGVSGDYSFTSGRHNQVLSEQGSALGYGNITSTYCGTSIGRFCEDENALFIVGNGNHQWDRSNALVLAPNGQLTIAGDLLYNNNVSLSEKITSLTPTVYNCTLNEAFATDSHISVNKQCEITTVNVYLYTNEEKTFGVDDTLISGLPSASNLKGGFIVNNSVLNFTIDADGNLKPTSEITIPVNTPIVGTYVY